MKVQKILGEPTAHTHTDRESFHKYSAIEKKKGVGI